MSAKTVAYRLLAVVLWGLWPGSAAPVPSAGQSAGAVTPRVPDVELEASVNADRICTSDLLTFSVTVTYPDDVRIDWPPEQMKPAGFDVVEMREHAPFPVSDRRARVRRDWFLAPNMLGSYSLEPLRVVARTADGIESVLATDPVTVEVQSLFPAGQPPPGLRDIAPCVRTGAGWLPVCAGLAAAALVGGAVLAASRRRRRAVAAAEPPGVVAQQALERLRRPPHGRNVSVELPRIVCRFLEARYGLPVIPLTAQIIVRRLAADRLPADLAAELDALFSACDRARFGPPASAAERPDALLGRFERCLRMSGAGEV